MKKAKTGSMQMKNEGKKKEGTQGGTLCPVAHQCGGCGMLSLPYEKQLAEKQKYVEKLLSKFGPVYPISGMSDPYHYRNKVHAVFDRNRNGNIISGTYREGTHQVIPVGSCAIEDQRADAIIASVRELIRSFHFKVYDEDSGTGLFRHILVRVGHASGQIMVVLVLASPVLPSRSHFVKALLALHPEITTIVLNVNNRKTSMILGERESVLYGKGYIEDTLCGLVFRISSRSFYQVNSLQTKILYEKAVSLAGLTGRERVIDAYCGIGTIGLIASPHAADVIGIENNGDAVRDAIENAKRNSRRNIRFYRDDAAAYMQKLSAAGKKGDPVDVVFMDPPRTGSTPVFIRAATSLLPKRIVYISCNPDTLARDLKEFNRYGYMMQGAWPVDMFPMTPHVETVYLLTHKD